MEDKAPPGALREFVSGAVRASVWEPAGQPAPGGPAPSYTVRITRQYRRDDGTYGDSPYFADDDLPRVAAVAQAAYSWLKVQEQPYSRPAPRPVGQTR